MDTRKGKPQPPTLPEKKLNKKPEAPNPPISDSKNVSFDKSAKISKVRRKPPANPLFIDVILNKVISFMEKKDLPACRQVCKIWNLRVIPRFQREFVCTIRHVPTFPFWGLVHGDVFVPGEDRTFGTFVKLMRSSICIPFAKYRLDLTIKRNSMTEFFKICGPEMTHVTLENWTLDVSTPKELYKNNLCFIRENINEMFKFSKKLQCLHFNTPIILSKNRRDKMVKENKDKPILMALQKVSFNGFQGPREAIPTFFEEFFARTPKIVGVDLMYDRSGYTTWPETTGAMMNAIATTGRISTIQGLTVDSSFRNEFVDQMEKDGTNLKTLRLKIYSDDLTVLDRLIELQKDSLHSLFYHHVRHGLGIGTGAVEFPRMKNLKVLRIHILSRVPIECTNLTFREMFPNLETMTYYSSNPRLNFLGHEPCPKLKSMDLRFDELDLTEFKNMTQVYSLSSLASLTLETYNFSNSEILKLIFSNLINLKALELNFTRWNVVSDFDSLFTGISVEECKKIRNDPDFWNFMKGMDKGNKLSELAKRRVYPSISDLKSLHRLHLKLPGNGLTDITGYLGLFEMEHIRHIHIDFCQFTKTCCEALKKERNLESWVFRQKKWLSDRAHQNACLQNTSSSWFQEKENMHIIRPYFYPYKDREDN